MNFDKILSDVSDYHIPCGMVVMFIGSALQWFHHLDASFVAFTTTVLTFLGAHAYMKFSNGGTPDDPAPTQVNK